MLFETFKRKNIQIIEIKMNGNELDDNCMKSICEYIQSSQSLKALGIGNNITNKGIEELSVHLYENTTLKEIDMRKNKGITDESVPCIIKIAKQSCVHSMNIESTSVSNKWQEEIKSNFMFQKNEREFSWKCNTKLTAKVLLDLFVLKSEQVLLLLKFLSDAELDRCYSNENHKLSVLTSISNIELDILTGNDEKIADLHRKVLEMMLAIPPDRIDFDVLNSLRELTKLLISTFKKKDAIRYLDQIKERVKIDDVSNKKQRTYVTTIVKVKALSSVLQISNDQSQIIKETNAHVISKNIHDGELVFSLFYDVEELRKEILQKGDDFFPNGFPVRFTKEEKNDFIEKLKVTGFELMIDLNEDMEKMLLEKGLLSDDQSKCEKETQLKEYYPNFATKAISSSTNNPEVFGYVKKFWSGDASSNTNLLNETTKKISELKQEYEKLSKLVQPTPDKYHRFVESPIMLLEDKLIQMIVNLLKDHYDEKDKQEKDKIKNALKDKELGELIINVYDTIFKQGKSYFNKSENHYYGKWHVFLSHTYKESGKKFGLSEDVFSSTSVLNAFFNEKGLKLGDFATDAMIFSAITCDFGFCFMNEYYFFKGNKSTLREFYLMQSHYKFERNFQRIPIFYDNDKSKIRAWTDTVVNAPLPGIDEEQKASLFEKRFDCDDLDVAARYIYERILKVNPDVQTPILVEGDSKILKILGDTIQFIKQTDIIKASAAGLNDKQEKYFVQKVNTIIANSSDGHQVLLKIGSTGNPSYCTALLFNRLSSPLMWGWKWWIDCSNKDIMEQGLMKLCDELIIPKDIEYKKRIEFLTNFMRTYRKGRPYLIVFFGLTKQLLDLGLFDFSLYPPNGSKIVIISNEEEDSLNYDVHTIFMTSDVANAQNNKTEKGSASSVGDRDQFRGKMNKCIESLRKEVTNVELNYQKFRTLYDQYGSFLVGHALDILNHHFEGDPLKWAEEYAKNSSNENAMDLENCKRQLLHMVYNFIKYTNSRWSNQSYFDELFRGDEIQKILDVCLDLEKQQTLKKLHIKINDGNRNHFPLGCLWINKLDLDKLKHVYKDDKDAFDVIMKSEHIINDAFDTLYEKGQLFKDRYVNYMMPEAPEWMLERIPTLKRELHKLSKEWEKTKNDNDMPQEMIDTINRLINNGGKSSLNRAKIMTGGRGRAGKSATIRSLTGQSFNPSLESTIGADAKNDCEVDIKYADNEWKFLNDEVRKEIASQHQARAYKAMKYEEERERVTKLEKSNDKKEENVKHNVNMFMSSAPSTSSIISSKSTISASALTSGNSATASSIEQISADVAVKQKHDEEKYELKGDIINKYIDDDGIENKITMSIWDLGGQKVFYTLHHLFLTEYAVYLVVFDMRELMSHEESMIKESLDYIRHWLESINMHARGAPIFMIGTFKDIVNTKNEHKFIDVELRKMINNQMKMFDKKSIVANDGKALMFWPIDNTLGPNSDDIKQLRVTITDVINNQSFIKDPIPLQWTTTYDMMMNTNKNHITINEFNEIASNNKLREGEDRLMMLRRFHQLGMLLYFDKGRNRLRNVIVLNPQWLVDAITKVIRPFNLHDYDGEVWKSLQSKKYYNEFKILKNESIASVELMYILWRDEDDRSQGKEDFTKRKYLLSLMEKMTLAAPWRFDANCKMNSNASSSISTSSDNNNNQPPTHYLIPSNLRLFGEEITNKRMEKINKVIPFIDIDDIINESANFYCIVIDFSDSFLPVGFYDRLICKLVSHSSKHHRDNRTPIIGNGSTLMSIGLNDIRIDEELSKRRIVVTPLKDCTENYIMLETIEYHIDSINKEMMNSSLMYVKRVSMWSKEKKRMCLVDVDKARNANNKKINEISAINGDTIEVLDICNTWLLPLERSDDELQQGKIIGFISHMSGETGKDAQLLKREGERYLKLIISPLKGLKMYYEENDLRTTKELMDDVMKMKVVIILLSKSYLKRPWCLVELYTAIKHDIPLILINVAERGFNLEAERSYFETVTPEKLLNSNDEMRNVLIDANIDVVKLIERIKDFLNWCEQKIYMQEEVDLADLVIETLMDRVVEEGIKKTWRRNKRIN